MNLINNNISDKIDSGEIIKGEIKNIIEEEEGRKIEIGCFDAWSSLKLLVKLKNLGYKWQSGHELDNKSFDGCPSNLKNIAYTIYNRPTKKVIYGHHIKTPKYYFKSKHILY